MSRYVEILLIAQLCWLFFKDTVLFSWYLFVGLLLLILILKSLEESIKINTMKQIAIINKGKK